PPPSPPPPALGHPPPSRPGCTGVGAARGEEVQVPKQFPVEVVAVEAKVYSGTADMLVARTTEGELAALDGHAPPLGPLPGPSRIRIKRDAEEIGYDVAGGFLSVTEDGVTVLAESAAPASGPDPPAARVPAPTAA